jgi:hypothetical protein
MRATPTAIAAVALLALCCQHACADNGWKDG